MQWTLVSIIRLVWVVATLPVFVALMPCSRLRPFRQVVMGFARRGKTMQSSFQRFTVPQTYFSHFYVLGIVWTTFLLVATWLYAARMSPMVREREYFTTIASQLTGVSRVFSSGRSQSNKMELVERIWQSIFLLLLMDVHVVRRLYETLSVFNYSRSARMHVMGYIAGLFFYTGTPLSLCCTWALDVFKFARDEAVHIIVEGKNQFPVNEHYWWVHVTPLTKLRWRQWAGGAIFLWGSIHQRNCHRILGSLRKYGGQGDQYLIPHGDWFEAVSSPHYLAEIVIYAGLVVASGGVDITIWLLFGFVVANLVLAAEATHGWYHLKFDNYPKERFAVIPFVC